MAFYRKSKARPCRQSHHQRVWKITNNGDMSTENQASWRILSPLSHWLWLMSCTFCKTTKEITRESKSLHWPLGDLDAICKLALLIGIFRCADVNALRWMPRERTDDQSTLAQIMAWCPQAASHLTEPMLAQINVAYEMLFVRYDYISMSPVDPLLNAEVFRAFVSPNKLLNKQWKCWFETPMHVCDNTVINLGDCDAFVHVVGGLHIVDVNSDRLRPTFVGCLDDDGYTHDAQCVVYHGPHRRYQVSLNVLGHKQDGWHFAEDRHFQTPFLVSKLLYFDWKLTAICSKGSD